MLTGETGAGKSILIDALQLALGARADSGVIREGASRTEISVEFDSPEICSDWLRDAGFEVDRLVAAAQDDRHSGQEPRVDQRQRSHGDPVARTRRLLCLTSTASTPGRA